MSCEHPHSDTRFGIGYAMALLSAGQLVRRDAWLEEKLYLQMEYPPNNSECFGLRLISEDGIMVPYTLTKEDITSHDWYQYITS